MNTEFILTSLVVVLLPGTGVIYTVSIGLFQGWRSSVAAAVGCTAGIIPHLLASIAGLSAILHTSAVAFQILKYAGAIYLLYLAWSMWRETGVLSFNSQEGDKGYSKIAARAVLINILNPKLSIFFLAFLPQFIQTQGAMPIMLQLLLLSIVFMVMTLVVFILYGCLAHRVRTVFQKSSRKLLMIQRSFALLFAGLGAKLAMTEQ